MREGIITLLDREYAYKFNFGVKSIRIVDDDYIRDWRANVFSTALGNFTDCPAFVRKRLAVNHLNK